MNNEITGHQNVSTIHRGKSSTLGSFLLKEPAFKGRFALVEARRIALLPGE